MRFTATCLIAVCALFASTSAFSLHTHLKVRATGSTRSITGSINVATPVRSSIIKDVEVEISEAEVAAIDMFKEEFGREDDDEQLGLETKNIFFKCVTCPLTKLLARIGGDFFVNEIKKGGVGNNTVLSTEQITLGWIKKPLSGSWTKAPYVAEDVKQISKKFKTSILGRDDLSENDEDLIDVLLQKRIMRLFEKASSKVIKVRDSDVPFADEAQAHRIASDLKFVKGEALPLTYNEDFNMQTDESFSRIFFHGIAAPLIAASEEVTDPKICDTYGPFVVDMEFMKDLPLRDTDMFKRYGARVHFDENQMVSAIYDFGLDKLVLPGDSDWEEAKFQAKVSAFTLCTVREHLSHTHLIISNDASREIVKCLHPEHPIRRLLSIFTYNAVGVNKNAFTVLTPENSVIHRATALTYDGMQAVFDNAYSMSNAYEPFPSRKIKNPAVQALADHRDEMGNAASKFPYLSEGKEFYDITHNFVKEWLEEAGSEASDKYARDFYDATRKASSRQLYELPEYSHDNMVDLISTIIFYVTGYHELIGHVPDYTDSPFKAGFRVPKESPCQIDMQSFFIAAVISASTSVPAPQLMAEFPNFIGKDAPEWEKDVWTRFIAKMGLQAKKVQDDQWKRRNFEFKYFDPSLFECSVSV